MTPYEEGKAAVLSNELEPENPYYPGSRDYKQFADGFCENGEYIRKYRNMGRSSSQEFR